MSVRSACWELAHGHVFRTLIRKDDSPPFAKKMPAVVNVLQDANVLSEGTRPAGEGACRKYNRTASNIRTD